MCCIYTPCNIREIKWLPSPAPRNATLSSFQSCISSVFNPIAVRNGALGRLLSLFSECNNTTINTTIDFISSFEKYRMNRNLYAVLKSHRLKFKTSSARCDRSRDALMQVLICRHPERSDKGLKNTCKLQNWITQGLQSKKRILQNSNSRCLT